MIFIDVSDSVDVQNLHKVHMKAGDRRVLLVDHGGHGADGENGNDT